MISKIKKYFKLAFNLMMFKYILHNSLEIKLLMLIYKKYFYLFKDNKNFEKKVS